MEELRIDLLARELRRLKPSGLGDVFEFGFGMGDVEVAALETRQEPELDEPALRVDQVFDVDQALNVHIKACLFPHFPAGCLLVALVALNAAARSHPEVITPVSNVVNHQKPSLVLNNGAGGDAIEVQM
jgi:hypothetical protein